MYHTSDFTNRIVLKGRLILGICVLYFVFFTTLAYGKPEGGNGSSGLNREFGGDSSKQVKSFVEIESELKIDVSKRGSTEYRFKSLESIGSHFAPIASLDFRPMALTVSSDDRIFVSIASELGDSKNQEGVVREILPDGSSQPFPTAWYVAERLPVEELGRVDAMTVDKDGVLWIVDTGKPPLIQPKLVGWDIKRDELYKIIYLPTPITKQNSSLRSIAIDSNRKMAFIADQGRRDWVGKSESAIISVDLKTGQGWRALEDHYSLNADGGDFVQSGQPLLAPDGRGSVVRPSLGIVSVGIGQDGELLFFSAANGRSIFTISIELLAKRGLSSASIGEGVKRFGDKSPSEQILQLSPEFILVTDVNNSGIGVVSVSGSYQLLANSEGLSWPTYLAKGSQGEVYVTSSQLNKAPLFNAGEDFSKHPFLIYRFVPRIKEFKERLPPEKTKRVVGKKVENKKVPLKKR